MGRGSSGRSESGGIRSVIVNFGSDRGGPQEYRVTDDGRIYRQDSLEILPTNMTLQQMAERARGMGFSVETYNAAQTQARDEARRRERANRPDYELGVGLEDNSAYRRVARRNILTTRVMRRATRRAR